MAIEKMTNFDRIKKIVPEDVSEAVYLDPASADAYQSSIDNAEHVDEVIEELEKKAEEITEPVPEVTNSLPENIYTKRYTLDESMEEFKLTSDKPTKVYDDDEFDTYWDMDMFDFVYEIVSTTDARRKPLDPLGRPHTRFAVTGRDKYAGLSNDQIKAEKEREKEQSLSQGLTSSPQISVGDGYIELYAHDVERFNDIEEICRKYLFKTDGPHETFKLKRNKFYMRARDEWMEYEYSFKVYYPCDSNGIPLRIEDYFEPIGFELEDVMNPDFCRHYRRIQKRIEKEAEELLAKKEKQRAKELASRKKSEEAAKNDEIVKEIYDKHHLRAARSNDDLEGFIQDMFKELDDFRNTDGSKLKYSKSALKSQFMDDFNDDFDEE